MPSIEIAYLRRQYLEWSNLSDKEFAAKYAQKQNEVNMYGPPVHVIVKYKDSKDEDYSMFSLCSSRFEVNMVFESPYCFDPVIIYDDGRAPIR